MGQLGGFAGTAGAGLAPLGGDAWAVPSSPALLLLPLPARSS